MKKLILSVGLSLTVLMSVSFAQIMQKKIAASVTPATAMAKASEKQVKEMNPKIAEKFAINEFRKHATAPIKRGHPAIKHVATYVAEDPEKATLELRVGDVWGDGSGYQLLIDADATLCDTGFYYGIDQDNLRAYYDMAEYKVPEDALLMENYVMDGQSASVQIEPGVYDVLVLNPTPDFDYIFVAGGNAIIDDFEFEKGYTYIFEISLDGFFDDCTLIGPHDLKAGSLEFPVSCEIGDEVEVKFAVTNNGTAAAEEFTLAYALVDWDDPDLDPDDLEFVEETFTETLEAGETRTFTFTQKLTEIEEGKMYAVYALVYPLEGELEDEDNEALGCFAKNEGLKTLPYTFDFNNYDFVPASPYAWLFDEDEDGSYAEANFEYEVPLVSKCFDLEAGKVYRLSYEYWAGLAYMFEFPEDYHIGFGLTSEPMSEWDIVLEEQEVFEQNWSVKDVQLEPKTTGTYAIYFSADYMGYMGLRNISITEVADHDARLNAFNTGLPRLTTPRQINGTVTASATVENRGSLDIDEATLSVKMGETELGSKKVSGLKPGDIKDVELSLNISGLKTGDKAVFTANVALEGEAEAQLDDNTKKFEVEVNDYVMAYDYVTKDMYDENHAIGGSSSIACGIPFTLINKDTITAVSLGLCAQESNMTIGIRIAEWNKETQTLGDLIYEAEVRRGMEAGQREYKVPSIILEAGDYMISAVQPGNISIGLIADGIETGGLYVTSVNPPVLQKNLGTPAIRAVFGPDAKPMAKDAVVMEITKPKETGLFAENQEVIAKVGNRGYEAVKVPFTLLVNGKVVSTNTVELDAYANGEVNFIADLSAYNTEYVLTVFSALEGDEDLSNDTCTKIVNSLEPANPYVLDFESCEDFIIDGFNPAWKAVDVDGYETYSFSGYTFPHQYEPMAYMVFNPYAIGAGDAESMLPHGGERYGAAFATTEGANNDWLISPKLKIVEGKEFMKFFVKSLSDAYGLEEYNVWISTTDDNIESFEQIGETREAPADAWEEVNIELTEYSGKEVHLAIQCVSEDIWMFMIDDIYVCTDDAANEKVAPIASLLSLYPNPAHEMITIHALDAQIRRVAIFNTSGIMVYQSKELNTTDYRYSVKGLSAGIYFARVATDRGTTVMKFIVR